MNPKIKNFAVIGSLVVIFAVAGAGKYLGWFSQNADGGTVVATATGVKGAVNTSAVTVELPPQPVNGTLKGVVEVGATGFNAFVVEIDSNKNYRVVKKLFDSSGVKNGTATFEELKAGLKSYLDAMSNYGVGKNNLHFVVSSGALKEDVMTPISNELKSRGFVVNLMSAQQEGIFAYKAAMNPKYMPQAFVVDLGSNNTKISWFESGGIKTEELPGSKYFSKPLNTDASMFERVKSVASRIPENQRGICFLIGGTPYSLVKGTIGSNRYTPLQSLDAYQAGEDKKMASGLNILKAIQAATNTQFVFDADANFTIGFLMSLR